MIRGLSWMQKLIPSDENPGVRRVTEGSGEQGKMEETGCEIICGAPATLAVKGQMMMTMMMENAGQVA